MHYKNHSQLQLYISLFLKTSQDADHSVNKALNICYFTLAFWCYFGLWFHFYYSVNKALNIYYFNFGILMLFWVVIPLLFTQSQSMWNLVCHRLMSDKTLGLFVTITGYFCQILLFIQWC